MGVPPELFVYEKIFTYQKNLREFCRLWHDGKEVYWNSVYGTLDMLRLNMSVLEVLVEERKRG